MGTYPLASWRLLRSEPVDGAMNMAVDEAILHAVATGKAPPTLRFYAWEPPCLSLGRAQKISDVDLDALEMASFDLVRRPTGGKAILHADELTYSVVAPETEARVEGGVVESYRRLSTGLVRGLEKLGETKIVADRRAPPPSPPHRGGSRDQGPVCFKVPSDYEITVDGRKLVGSAQMRAQGAVLQHGTLPLHGDIARICPLLIAHPNPARVRTRATTVEEAFGRQVSWNEAAAALAEGFAEALNLSLEFGELTEEERVRAKQLRDEKYGVQTWTRRV